jgi:hypothetical protein
MALRLEISVAGSDRLTALLRALASVGPEHLAGALYEEAEAIKTESQALVPVDTSVLKNSAFVATEGRGDTFVAQVGYGGAAAEYAVIQHEDLTFYHDDGQAKFLEQPALEHAKDLGERLVARMQARLKV